VTFVKGHVRKRGSKWTVVYDELPDAATGRRKQRWRGGFATKREAEKALVEILGRLHSGGYVVPTKQTLGAFLADEWLPSAMQSLRPLSVVKYRQVVNGHLLDKPLASMPLQAISTGHVNALYADMEKGGAAVSTRRIVHAVLHRSLEDAVRWGKLTRNPAKGAIVPAAPKARSATWTERELRTFLASVESDRLRAFWHVAAMTGARRGEVLGLRWLDVDLDGSRMAISQQLVPTEGGLTFAEPKTAAGRRTLALAASTVGVLRRHRDNQILERQLLGPEYHDLDLVFAQVNGRPIYPSRVTETFREIAKTAGLPMIRLHDLRHTWATLALTNGIPVHVVSAALGHADPALTLRVYSHLLPRSSAEAAEKFAALVVADR
jgi:integrase